MGINRNFMVAKSDSYSNIRHTVKYKQKKKAINGSASDKAIVFENPSCKPFLPNLTKEFYYFAK
jgi:hypothetical protein